MEGNASSLESAMLTLAVASASCGSPVRQGTGTSFLIVNELEFARGNEPETVRSANLLSDVVTVVDDVPTFFNDVGAVTFSLGFKDPGPAGSPIQPTQNQFITVDRTRAVLQDRRSQHARVDVPYEFDGAFTVTVGSSQAEAASPIVRNIAKRRRRSRRCAPTA